MTSIALGPNRYGKSAVRLVTVTRGSGRHELREVTVDVALEGDFEAAHRDGENAGLIATDTMRNAVYVLAREQGVAQLECFGIALARYFLDASPRVSRARIGLVEHPWARLAPGDEPHEHAFERGAGGQRVAEVAGDGDGVSVEAGVEGLSLLRTTGSGWAGFLRERCTTLPETHDRILATTVSARWTYDGAELDFDALWHDARAAILTTFADHESPSVQFTLQRVGEAVLATDERIRQVHLSLPNQHHDLVDLEPFGLANDNEVFCAKSEPYGLIEGTIIRTENR